MFNWFKGNRKVYMDFHTEEHVIETTTWYGKKTVERMPMIGLRMFNWFKKKGKISNERRHKDMAPILGNIKTENKGGWTLSGNKLAIWKNNPDDRDLRFFKVQEVSEDKFFTQL